MTELRGGANNPTPRNDLLVENKGGWHPPPYTSSQLGYYSVTTCNFFKRIFQCVMKRKLFGEKNFQCEIRDSFYTVLKNVEGGCNNPPPWNY